MNKIFLLIISVIFISCGDVKLEKNKQAPEIMVKNTEKKSVKLRRQNIELVEFWQNGCSACLKVMSELEAFAKENNIFIYAINSIDNFELVKNHEKNNEFSNIIFLKDELDISWQRYEVFAVPTIFILKDGVYVDKIVGDRGFKYIKEKIKAYL